MKGENFNDVTYDYYTELTLIKLWIWYKIYNTTLDNNNQPNTNNTEL